MAGNKTKVQESIADNSDKVVKAKKAIRKKTEDFEYEDIAPESITTDHFKDKQFEFPENTVRLGTLFSGIGAIEHAFDRLKLKHQIVFANDIDQNCKKAYFANYNIK